MIRSIITTRYSNRWPTWQMVHEWEDILAEQLGVSLKPLGERCMVSDPDNGPHCYDLMFLQLPGELRYYEGNRQLIPIVMDLWRNDFDEFRLRAGSFRLIFVTSLQAYRELSPALPNLCFLPFCLADRYLDWDLPPKDIDVIHYGRRNPVLENYMAAFLERYPATSYVTTEVSDDGQKVMIHSNLGGLLGESDSRTTFMGFLARSRVSLVSTVGMDGSRDTGGINPVSPRFYESLAAGCHLVGRIPDNEEFRESGMEHFCRHVNNFDEFEATLLQLIADDDYPRKTCMPFLRQHLASALAPQILTALNNPSNTNYPSNLEFSMQAVKPQTDLAHRLALFGEMRSALSPSTAFTNYRTLSDVIGFYAEFWGLDLFHRFTDIIAAQRTATDSLQYQALELLYRKEIQAACIVARRAMELGPDNPYAAALYADLLRRTGDIDVARAACLELQRAFPNLDEARAVLDMCDVDELLPLALEHYHLLHMAHTTLKPRSYIEIGVSSGRSLALAGSGTSTIGVDPVTAIPEQQFFHSPATAAKLFRMTSNDFFQQGLMEEAWGGASFDMAFIDGMHLFEQALVDFVNLERRSEPGSVIFIHDCLPVSVIGAERERRSMVWTGDVWKVIPCLKAVRPDLEIVTFPVRPSGLAMVRNPDRRSKVLSSQFDAIVEHFMTAQLPEDMNERFRMLNVTDMAPQTAIDQILACQGAWQGEH